MNPEKIIKIVMMELTTDTLKTEQELERVMNKDLTTEDKTIKIKALVSELVRLESCMTKLSSMITNEEK